MVEYKYNAWGACKILNADGSEDTSVGSLGWANPIRYRGYYYDNSLGLYYLTTRYYDPETGRFTSADDSSYLAPNTVNGLNLYAYCNNNPVMNTDPDGHAWWKWLVAIVVVVVCAVAAVATAGTSLVAGAALAGAAVGGATSVAKQAVDVSQNGGDFSFGEFVADTAIGALSGVAGGGITSTLPMAGSLLTSAGTTASTAVSTTGVLAGAGTLAGVNVAFSKHDPGMSNRAPVSWTNNKEGLEAMRRNNMDANKAAEDIMNNHVDGWRKGAGTDHNAVKKWLDRVIRKMIQGGK